MGIYSANRSGNISISQIPANENYTCLDFGRILYESTVNDQKIFESILANDFREIQSMREGTLLESEIKALNEASLKEFFSKMKDRIMKFFAKIKGAIKSAINKISAYIFKNGKAFVKEYRAVESKYGPVSSKKGLSIKYKARTSFNAMPDFIDKTVDQIKTTIEKESKTKEVDKGAIVGWYLGKVCKANNTVTPAEYREKIIDKCFEDNTITSADSTKINDMLSTIEKADNTIKELKDKEKMIGKVIQSCSSEITAAERDVERKEGSEDVSKVINRINMVVSAMETIVSNVISTEIKVVNLEVKANTRVLRSIMSYLKTGTVKEGAADIDDSVSVDAELDSELDVVPGEINDSDVQEEIDSVIESVMNIA